MSSFAPFPELKPVALINATEQCLKIWPLDDTPPELPLTNAEAIRIRAVILETTPGTQLKRRDVRGAFKLCLDNTETAEWVQKAIAILIAMPEQPGFNPLYDLYAGNYANVGLRQATSTAYAKITKEQRRVALDRIEKVLSDDPLVALYWDTMANIRPVAETLTSCRISKTSALGMGVLHETYDQVFNAPDRIEHAAWLRTHNATQIFELLATHYGTNELRIWVLGAVVRSWNMMRASVLSINQHPVINPLFQRLTKDDMLGDPMERKIRWESDRELHDLVRKWVLDKKIQSFFDLVDANEDRKDYWQSNVDIISDYEDLSSGRSAFAMKIGKIWFVEFGEKGNACYPYSDEAYRSIRRGKHVAVSWEYDPLKQINRVFLPDSALYFNENREFKVTDRRTLIHSERWYEKFDAYIKAFCDVQPQ